eukprot:SAG11_NODE_2274_length_3591_cov_3.168671_3_plen_456_part_00
MFAEMLAKEHWDRDDALTAATNMAAHMAMWAIGGFHVWEKAGVEDRAGILEYVGSQPYIKERQTGSTRHVPLALLVLDLLRAPDGYHEGVLPGAGLCLCWMAQEAPWIGKALLDAGLLDVCTGVLLQYTPMERIQRSQLNPTSAFCAMYTSVEAAQMDGVDVVQPLLDAGAIDIAISSLTAYHMLGNPMQASCCALTYGALNMLEVLLKSVQAKPIVDKLRASGQASFRYLLDHPRVNIKTTCLETGVQATKAAALVWGRDDDGGGLVFKQEEIDKVLQMADHRGYYASFYAMREDHGTALLSLTVSDINKQLLLSNVDFIPILVDSLLLDSEHPRRDDSPTFGRRTDFDAVAPPVQRVSFKPSCAASVLLRLRDACAAKDFAEAIAQLAMYPPGRDALVGSPNVAEALQQVAVEGWTEEARLHAESALAALKPLEEHSERVGGGDKHVCLASLS